MHARRGRNPYNDQIMLDHYRVKKLKEQYPAFSFNDITPIINGLRVIKSPREIDILRRNGKITAAAVKQAMRASGPGVYEYELEAAALHVIFKNGARGTAFPPIVGSGPNSCIMHYDQNNRLIKPGEVVLMDFGADLDYYCMDITRTWPASGQFTPEQREIYQTVLEVQKACIQAYRPGVTDDDVRAYVEEIMKKKQIDPRGMKGGIHHYVDQGTHGVGPRDVPLKEGMVFTIEPALYFPEKNFGVRIEDTVLITKDGCEVLTKDAPREIAEIETLMKEKG
jgi:Xaa-Pro aminopeptidase